MAGTITNELMYDTLKKLQADVAHIRERVDDHDQQFISVREQMHSLQGDVLRIDTQMIERLSRIARRLELADAE
jgi:septal ring factor EnvC (AmiA/AmiB activator)